MRLPEIRVPAPGPKATPVPDQARRLESPATASFGQSPNPIVIERGDGAVVEDADGNRFLDFVAGFGVLNLGHGHPKQIGAMQAQMAKVVHVMGAVNPTRTALMAALAEVTPGAAPKRILFATGGGEAIDMALRLVRNATGGYEALAFYGAYHGRGQGALSLMGRGYGRKGLEPMLAGAVHAPYPYCYRCPFGETYPECGLACARFVENLVKGASTGVAQLAAIFIEPVQGNGGMIPAPVEFLVAMRRLCDETGVLLVADEVMSGWGRTGRFFAIEHAGVEPDLLVMGKAMGGGIPLAAVVSKAAINEGQTPNRDSSTLAGNPVASAAALATIEVLRQDGLIAHAAAVGAYFLDGLKALAGEFEIIGDVRGSGLMLGFEVVKDRASKEPISGATRRLNALCLAEGLLPYPAGGHHGNVLGFLPPLIVTRSDVDAALGILRRVLGRYTAEVTPA
ncbi:MAG: aspartate aminotransferase family protein [Acetobacteraceae bacterium]